jgi:amidohydrolase
MIPTEDSLITAADVERIVPFEVLIDRIAESRQAEWIQCRRTLHAAPEPSGCETATSQYIQRYLQRPLIDSRIAPRDVGVIADMKIGAVSSDTPVIAVRADIDALRMPDGKSVSYASKHEGLAHACGHDAHTMVVLGTAELLQTVATTSQASELPPMHLRFIFQPAEETAEGAVWMIEDGVLEGVTAILGLHVDPTIHAGKIGVRYGVLTAQVDEVHISVRGRGGHAARPHNTTDPLAAAVMLVSSIYQNIPRHADALTPTVFTIGSIHGGTASNVIPDRVSLTGTLRTTDAETRRRVIDQLGRLCAAAALSSGCTIEPEFRSPLGSVINDSLVMSAFEAAATQVISQANIVRIQKPSMGGEDFAAYVQQVRGAQIRLGCAGDAPDWPLLHSPVFDIDESCIAIGARVMARTALLLAMNSRSSTR